MSPTDLLPEPPATALPMDRGRFLLFQVVLWALLSVIVVLPATRFPGVGWAECAAWVAGWAALGLACSSALAAAYGRVPERHLRGVRGILVIGLVCPAMAGVWTLALVVLEPLLGREPWAPPDVPPLLYLLVGWVRGTFLLGLWSALFLVNLLSRRVLAAREHSVRAQALADRMQLAVLRSQINPHFLFNALNSVVALIGENPRAAQTMVRDVATLLRASLDADARRETTVAQELSFVRLYLKCEQVRFEERLVVTWDLDPAVDTATVPPMMLHPLVENAVKHGMAGAVDAPLQVRITARRNGEALDFEVANTGTLAPPGDAALRATSGIGLRNVRGRLAHLFPGRHLFELVERDGWVVAHMRLPGPRDAGGGRGAVQ
jgi:two-component system LytT family sensor kinase